MGEPHPPHVNVYAHKEMVIGVTGANGFIGKHLAASFLERGFKVHGLDRKFPAPSVVSEDSTLSRLQLFEGDINDATILEQFTKGCVVVVHTAAIVEEHGDPAAFERVNVDGTRLVSTVAAANGVEHLIHISSVMAYGMGPKIQGVLKETAPREGLHSANPYCWSKAKSEDAALSPSLGTSMCVTIVRPGDVFGVGSVPWVKRPVKACRAFGRIMLPSYGSAFFDHTHVDNVVQVLNKIIDSPRWKVRGEVFNVSDGCDTTVKEYFSKLSAAIGAPEPIGLPDWLVVSVASVYAFVASKMFRVQNPVATPESVHFIDRHFRADISKAEKILGYEPVDKMEETLVEVGKKYHLPPPRQLFSCLGSIFTQEKAKSD